MLGFMLMFFNKIIFIYLSLFKFILMVFFHWPLLELSNWIYRCEYKAQCDDICSLNLAASLIKTHNTDVN